MNVKAQNFLDTINSPPEPIGGLERLVLRYYDIEFTPSQRALLDTLNVELIFFVSDEGHAKLETVNGIRNSSIIDSLFSRNIVLPKFKPEIRFGIPKQSLYFVQFEFPRYVVNVTDPYRRNIFNFHRPSRDDFEEIRVAKTRFDLIIGAMANTFLGSPSQYLASGGGMKIELDLTLTGRFFYGINMNVFGNRRRDVYNISSSLPQYTHPPTLLIGGTFGKWLGLYTIQFEGNYALQNITERLQDDDSEWEQFSGFSPAFLLSRPLQVGNDKFSVDGYYGSPTMLTHYVNVSVGIRYLWLDHKAASGFMAEFGIAYRLGLKTIESYTLKDSFYE